MPEKSCGKVYPPTDNREGKFFLTPIAFHFAFCIFYFGNIGDFQLQIERKNAKANAIVR